MITNLGENGSLASTDRSITKPIIRPVARPPEEGLDCWDIKPSRLAFIFYLLITLAAFTLLLVLWFYDQRHPYELLAVLVGYLLLLYRERSVVYQSRVSFQLRYHSKVWWLNTLPGSMHIASPRFKLAGKYSQLRIMVDTPLFIRVLAESDRPVDQQGFFAQRITTQGFFIWRDQLPYSKWRFLLSRLAAP